VRPVRCGGSRADPVRPAALAVRPAALAVTGCGGRRACDRPRTTSQTGQSAPRRARVVRIGAIQGTRWTHRAPARLICPVLLVLGRVFLRRVLRAVLRPRPAALVDPRRRARRPARPRSYDAPSRARTTRPAALVRARS